MLTFKQDTHEYFYESKKVPSVTGILKETGFADFSNVDPELLERARIFGIAVHKGCELLDKGKLDINTISKPLIPYIDAWQKFKDTIKCNIIECEKIVFSKKYMVAGTLDRVIEIDKKIYVLDIKTGKSIYKSYGLQLAGYCYLYNEQTKSRIKDRLIVNLGDGDFKLTFLKKENYELEKNIFLGLVSAYHYKKGA